MRILLIEDDAALADGLIRALQVPAICATTFRAGCMHRRHWPARHMT